MANEQVPSNIEEALKPRLEQQTAAELQQNLTKQQIDTTVKTALREASAEDQTLRQMQQIVGSDPAADLTPEEQEELSWGHPKSLLEAIHETQKDLKHSPTPMDSNPPTTPVSQPIPQPVIQDSFQASVGKSLPDQTEQMSPLPSESMTVAQMTEKLERLKAKARTPECARLIAFVNSEMFPASFVNYHLIDICQNANVLPLPSSWKCPKSFDLVTVTRDILRTPGYIDGIWPIMSIIMASSIGNTTWAAKVATTIAFYDAIKLLPIAEQAEKYMESQG